MVDGVEQAFRVVCVGEESRGREERKVLFAHPEEYGGTEVFGEAGKKRQEMVMERAHSRQCGGEFVKEEQDIGGDGLKGFVEEEGSSGVWGGVAESDHREQELFEFGREEEVQKRGRVPSPFFEKQTSCFPKAPSQGHDGDLKPLLKKGGEGFGRSE